METFLKDKKLNVSVFILIIIVSLFGIIKIVKEINGDSRSLSNQPANTISVTGTGDVTAVSDIATLTVNLSKDGKTAKEAQDLLNTSITSTLGYLKDQKIDDKDIKSEYGGLTPKYSYNQPVCYTYPCPAYNPIIVGYTATQSITIKVRVVDDASTIRTGLAGLGITDISGPTFSIDNEDAFKDQARAIAITQAKTKAETLAKELGVRLDKVTSFTENTDNPYPVMYDAKAMVGAGATSSAAPAPTLPKGENKITSDVTITYEIK
jgi:uncharacterized protein YggE